VNRFDASGGPVPGVVGGRASQRGSIRGRMHCLFEQTIAAASALPAADERTPPSAAGVADGSSVCLSLNSVARGNPDLIVRAESSAYQWS